MNFESFICILLGFISCGIFTIAIYLLQIRDIILKVVKNSD